MRMTGNNVLLAPLKTATVSPGGIHLPHNAHRPWVASDDQMQYRVIAVGPGKWVRRKKRKNQVRGMMRWEKPEVAPGDRVLAKLTNIKDTFDDHSGRLIIDAQDILMKW
jgi:co-chaperonin GroES (HSP10)